jgi:hypothetical protein
MTHVDSDSSNGLRALFGLSFHCRVCKRKHRPTSQLIDVCAGRLARNIILRCGKAYGFSAGQIATHLRCHLRCLSLGSYPPFPAPAELATSDGAERYRRRYQAWQHNGRS